MVGVPVSKMLEGEMQKAFDDGRRLRQRVIGQDEALEAVANAVRRAPDCRIQIDQWALYLSGSSRGWENETARAWSC
jgi:hypothetical protein